MDINTFYELYNSREACLRVLFAEKHKQYGTNEDVFKNNMVAAALVKLSPESYLIANVSKHLAVLCTLSVGLSDNHVLGSSELTQWRESMDDISLWMSILNGLLEERFQRGVAEGGT